MTGEQPASDIGTVALGPWMAMNVVGFRHLDAIEKFPGGQSNPTYRIDDGGRSYVLRRKPFGAILPSAHAVEREYRVLAALHPLGFPVAEPLALCEDASVIGVPFYLTEFKRGRTFWDGALPEQAPDERGEIYRSMVATLARLHAIDPVTVGLGDYGAPGNYFERQVRRWTKQYRAAQTDELPTVEKLIEWLPQRLPEQRGLSIIHGDYRIDNLIYAEDREEVIAVLDWELSTLGDPLADFAYLAMSWAMPRGDRKAQLGGLDLDALGIPQLEEVTALYCEEVGRSEVPDLNWHFAHGLFRLLSIVQGIKKRAIDGNASNANAAEMGAQVPELAEWAWEFAQRAGAPD